MVTKDNLRVYLAIKKADERSHIEDTMVLDGIEVRTFGSAGDLWLAFQEKPARLIISDRRFIDGFSGLDLAQQIRKHHMLPYVYVVVLSSLSHLKEIKDGLVAGVDDYLVKPYNRFQLRTRVLVGMRWLNYIDSLYESKPSKQ
ncbi:MAG: response regulator [Verrucomicrobiales bacterium]|nr:response regulator [Verrucomicrobiales bacterium]